MQCLQLFCIDIIQFKRWITCAISMLKREDQQWLKYIQKLLVIVLGSFKQLIQSNNSQKYNLDNFPLFYIMLLKCFDLCFLCSLVPFALCIPTDEYHGQERKRKSVKQQKRRMRHQVVIKYFRNSRIHKLQQLWYSVLSNHHNNK